MERRLNLEPNALDEIQLLEGHMNFGWWLMQNMWGLGCMVSGAIILKTLSKILNQNSQYQHPNFQKLFIFIESAGSIQKNVLVLESEESDSTLN